MNFKRSRKTLPVLVLALFTFVSCQRFTDDEKPKDEAIQFQATSLHCLNNVAPTLKRIFSGNVVDQEVDQAFGCLHNALEEFRDKTTDTIYTSQNLVRFLNSHLLQGNHIQKNFEVEIMKIKKLFLGGDDQTLTRTELNDLIHIFDVIGLSLKKIGPHLPLYLQDEKIKTATRSDIDRAVAKGQEALLSLFDEMKIEKADYDLSDAAQFLAELSKFMKGDELTVQIDKFRDLIPFVQVCIDGAYGNSRNRLPINELKDRTASLIRGYGYYLEYHYQLTDNQMKTPQDMAEWISFLDRVLDLIEKKSALASRGLRFTDIHAILVDLKKRDWLPWEIKTESLNKTLKVVFHKMGASPSMQANEDVINIAHWRNIRWEYSQWRLAQVLLAQVPFDKNGYVKTPQLLSWMKHKAPVDKTLNSEKWTPLQKQWLKNSWAELQALYAQKRPVRYNAPGGILLLDDASIASLPQNWTDLLRFNVIRSFNRLFFLGYSNHLDVHLFASHITEQKLEEWYEDFTPIGVDLKFFDPRSGNSGARSFLEANNFTAYSDGNKVVDYNEGYQYVSYLFAAGLVNANRVYDIMKPQGCAMKEFDILGNPYLEEKCFKNSLRRQFRAIFSNLPYQVTYVSSLNDAGWNEYYLTLMAASRNFPTYAGVKVETSDVRTLVTISHYVESLFTQFDVNRDGLLDPDEVKAGSTRFLPILKDLYPWVPEFLLKEAFIVLVMTGTVPDLQTIYESLKDEVMGDRRATRLSLLKVIIALKDQAGR